jgi:hypothetical protein
VWHLHSVLELGERNLLQHIRHGSPAQTKRSPAPFSIVKNGARAMHPSIVKRR